MTKNQKKNLEERVLGMNARNAEFVYPQNPRKFLKLANDKLLTKQRMEQHQIATAKTYGVVRHMGEIQQVWELVKHHKTLAIKPANGSGGGGILILKQEENNWITPSGKHKTEEQIFYHIANALMGVFSFGDQDRVIIEYCITSHPFLLDIYPQGVADFRVILLEAQPALAMLRVPTDQSDGKANLHAGGMGIGIDMASGRLKKGYLNQRHHSIHLDTQFRIDGALIPCWSEIVQLSIETAKVFPELGYLGIDIVIDKQLGPLVIEINGRPGLGIQVVNQVGLQNQLMQLQKKTIQHTSTEQSGIFSKLRKHLLHHFGYPQIG